MSSIENVVGPNASASEQTTSTGGSDAECVRRCEGVVDQYRRDEVTKSDADLALHQNLLGAPSIKSGADSLPVMLGLYLSMLDKADKSAEQAHQQGALPSSQTLSEEHSGEMSNPVQKGNLKKRKLLGQISRPRLPQNLGMMACEAPKDDEFISTSRISLGMSVVKLKSPLSQRTLNRHLNRSNCIRRTPNESLNTSFRHQDACLSLQANGSILSNGNMLNIRLSLTQSRPMLLMTRLSSLFVCLNLLDRLDRPWTTTLPLPCLSRQLPLFFPKDGMSIQNISPTLDDSFIQSSPLSMGRLLTMIGPFATGSQFNDTFTSLI